MMDPKPAPHGNGEPGKEDSEHIPPTTFDNFK